MRITDERNTFERPQITQQDVISSDVNLFSEKLKNFVEIHPDNLEDIDAGIWIKYISCEGKYRSGGVLKYNKAPKFFILKNPYTNLSWSVDLKKNTIFMKDISDFRTKMIEKNNLYKLYEAGLVKILDENLN